VQKNYPLADYIYYLPLDSPSIAKKFVSIVKPVVAIFIKYEFWYNYCQELKQNDIPIVSISSIFRPDQLFFKSYGEFYRRILFTFSHFFVQNDVSVKLLNELNIMACTRAGDTRFDRVYQVVKDGGAIPVAEKFKGSQKLLVVGSCWEEDLDVLAPFINENYYQLKFIIAPHEITENFINTIETSLLVKSIRFSKATSLDNLEDYQVLIIDNIGMLSRLFRYGEFAFVGGAYGKGLHNFLEAACYGVPLFFGDKNYEKYEEANELIMRGGAFEVSDYTDLRSKYEMINLPENFMLACDVTKFYVEENLGATDKIMNYLNTILK
jgi:3-deoxy-D-manno-octulosonic-acid transferase